MSRASVEERFWAKVDKSGECWLWTGCIDQKGYGRFSYNGRTSGAYRFALEQSGVTIPDGMSVDHICHNPGCVRPDHLRVVTHKQNMENRIGAHRGSRSGVRGVTWHNHAKKWNARVSHNGKTVSLGYFKHLDDAEFAVTHKRNELFTHNDADRTAAALEAAA